MPAKNIECQLAQGQIGRYLAGANMSEESVAQLEGHIAECEDCSAYIDQKKKSLKELATLRKAAVYMEEPAEADVEAPASAPEPKHPAAKALIDAIREKTAAAKTAGPILETKREVGTPRVTHWKALAYSTGLGLVLYGMTFVTANPTALFGGLAAEATPPAESSKGPVEESPATPPAPMSSKADGDPFTEDAPAPKAAAATEPPATAAAIPEAPEPTPAAAPTISSESTPTQPRVEVRSKPVSRPVRAPRPTTAPVTRRPNSIRVYDENGRPITGG